MLAKSRSNVPIGKHGITYLAHATKPLTNGLTLLTQAFIVTVFMNTALFPGRQIKRLPEIV